MARWSFKMRAAIKFMEDLEDCLSDNCYKFDVYWLPWQSNGGRSEGVTAHFTVSGDYGNGLYVTVYEHWNTDAIDIRCDKFMPSHMLSDHDEPHMSFGSDCVAEACLAAQMFMLQYLNLEPPKEWYVPASGYGGICIADAHAMKTAHEAIDQSADKLPKREEPKKEDVNEDVCM